MISVRNLSFAYSVDRPLLANLDLEIPSGAVVAITGENGAGKSTLLRLLHSELQPLSGTIVRTGRSAPPVESFVDQDPSTCIWPDLTVHAHVLVSSDGAGCLHRFDHPNAVKRVRQLVTATVPGLLDSLEVEAHRLSRGQLQMLVLCMALARTPEHLYLDEMSASLSQENRARAWDVVMNHHRVHNTTVVFISHEPDEVSRFADVQVELADGRARVTQVRAHRRGYDSPEGDRYA